MIDKILAVIALVLLVAVIGGMVYDEARRNDVTVIVDLKDGEDPFQAIKQITPEQSVVKEIKQINKK